VNRHYAESQDYLATHGDSIPSGGLEFPGAQGSFIRLPEGLLYLAQVADRIKIDNTSGLIDAHSDGENNLVLHQPPEIWRNDDRFWLARQDRLLELDSGRRRTAQS
jgi:hypothetical protein